MSSRVLKEPPAVQLSTAVDPGAGGRQPPPLLPPGFARKGPRVVVRFTEEQKAFMKEAYYRRPQVRAEVAEKEAREKGLELTAQQLKGYWGRMKAKDKRDAMASQVEQQAGSESQLDPSPQDVASLPAQEAAQRIGELQLQLPPRPPLPQRAAGARWGAELRAASAVAGRSQESRGTSAASMAAQDTIPAASNLRSTAAAVASVPQPALQLPPPLFTVPPFVVLQHQQPMLPGALMAGMMLGVPAAAFLPPVRQ